MLASSLFKAVPRGLAVAVLVVFGLLCSLGAWQVQRMHWKQQLIADMARTQTLAPIAVGRALVEPNPAWRTVNLPSCHLATSQLIYMHSEMAGRPGYRVLGACPTGDGTSLLVDLGFSVERISSADIDIALPSGRLRPFEKAGMVTPRNRPEVDDWYWRSPLDMQGALGAALRDDYFVVLDLKASQLAVAGLAQGALTAPLPNRHLEYALTWFALAGVLLAMFAALIVQKANRR